MTTFPLEFQRSQHLIVGTRRLSIWSAKNAECAKSPTLCRRSHGPDFRCLSSLLVTFRISIFPYNTRYGRESCCGDFHVGMPKSKFGKQFVWSRARHFQLQSSQVSLDEPASLNL